jgi:hypothetical protein
MRTGLVTLDASGAFIVTDYSSERDETAAERKREQRKRDKAVTDENNLNGRADVTAASRQCHENVTPLEKEKEEEKDIEKEGEVFAQSANTSKPTKKTFAESKPQKALKSEAEQKRGIFFAKIADVCKIPSDSKPHARSINAAALWFASKQIAPERLDEFAAWWFANDWRGLKNEYPKPDQIVSEWTKFEMGVTAKKRSQLFAQRQTKGEMQMSNIEAGISAFLAGGDK